MNTKKFSLGRLIEEPQEITECKHCECELGEVEMEWSDPGLCFINVRYCDECGERYILGASDYTEKEYRDDLELYSYPI